MKRKKISIIGAGPTGIFTALFLKNFDGEIHLFEKNTDIGEKLKLTGGGRMNISNKIFSSEQFFSNSDPKFRLKNNFFKNKFCQTENLMSLFDELGIEYSWENNRAMLKSQNAKTEVARLKEKLLSQKNLTIHLNTEISQIDVDQENTFTLKHSAKIFSTDFLIICTGGMFQIGEQCQEEKTYSLPKFLGHSIVKVSPSLSPLRIRNHLLSKSSGIALPVKIFSGIYKGKKKKYEKEITDSLLITHFGISGPAVLDFSALWNEQGKEKIFLNFLPKNSPEEFKKELCDLRSGKHTLFKFLQKYLPKRLSENIINILGIQKTKNIAVLSKKEEEALIEAIFSFDISTPELPQKFPYQGCWTTKGGVNLQEIEVSTLESKIHKNLFFGGEILDIDGLCGGYHISLSIICGKIIKEKILKESL